MNAQTIFERNEKKFLVPQRDLDDIIESLAPRLMPDDYGRHTICSLYLDTQGFDCAWQQQQKPAYREKLRLRSYGVPQPTGIVYLELKKKVDGVTYKRRTPLTLAEARAYLEQGMPPLYTGQVFGEIDWFIQKNALEPKAVICYDRIALCGPEGEGLRVTFDQNARWRDEALDLAHGDWGSPLMAPGTVLMEVKTAGAIPFWLCRVLSENALFTQPFSKYGTMYQNILRGEVMRVAG